MIEQHQDLENLTSIRDYIRLCYSQMMRQKVYFGHGHISAIDEARQLVLAAVYLPWDADELVIDAKLSHTECTRVLNFIDRRIVKREPLPYITNEAWFMQLPFYVDNRVIIPRSPIGQLIEQSFSPFLRPGPVSRILDMCTGSGCIGIACAYAFEEAAIDIADISKSAIEVAKINVAKHKLEDQVTVIESDLFSNIQKKYDLIVSNPPYVDKKDLASMPAEYQHEPELALGSGDDGLELCKQMLAQASQYLADDGLLVIEVGNSEVHLMAQFPDVPFIWIDLADGGNGVFAINAEDLKQCQKLFQ